MPVLIKDLVKTVPSSPIIYTVNPGKRNVSIANNSNGSGVQISVVNVNEYGGRDVPIIIDPGRSIFVEGTSTSQIIVEGEGANLSIVVTTEDETIRLEPITVRQTRLPFAFEFYSAVDDYQRAPSGATIRLKYRIRNPGSDELTKPYNVIVSYIGALCNAARLFRISRIVVQGGDLTTLLTLASKNAQFSIPGTSAKVSLSNGAPASDLTPGIHSELLQANVIREYREPFLIGPGQALDFQIGDAGDVTTDLMTMNLEFYSVPIEVT